MEDGGRESPSQRCEICRAVVVMAMVGGEGARGAVSVVSSLVQAFIFSGS